MKFILYDEIEAEIVRIPTGCFVADSMHKAKTKALELADEYVDDAHDTELVVYAVRPVMELESNVKVTWTAKLRGDWLDG